MATDQGYVLAYGLAATAAVKSSIDLAVRPHLHDVRAMLRLPLPDVGITAGCNFACVHVLLNVLSGLSRLMGPSAKQSDRAFKNLVSRPRFRPDAHRLGVIKAPTLTLDQLVELDNVMVRPHWVGATVVCNGPRAENVDGVSLYWGVRRLIFDRTSSVPTVRHLDRMIQDGWKQMKAVGRVWTATR